MRRHSGLKTRGKTSSTAGRRYRSRATHMSKKRTGAALTAAGAAGLLALWWLKQESQETSEPTPGIRTSGEDPETTAGTLPATLPECCVRVLGRPGWFDQGLLREVQIRPANPFVRAVTSPQVAGTDITAMTIRNTIYFRDPAGFKPHSPSGLGLIAHEVRHVEQYREQGGIVPFTIEYLREYLRGGYGTGIPFEAEAYEVGGTVRAHLEAEFAYNADHAICLTTPVEHTPNPEYAYLTPYPDLPRRA